MKRYIDIEATERAANDPALPERTRNNGIERVIAFKGLLRKHQKAVINDAIAKEDEIYVME